MSLTLHHNRNLKSFIVSVQFRDSVVRVNMASFIAVPLKKTSEIDLVKHLKYVFSSFCIAADEQVNYDGPLNELNKLRMNSTWRTLDKHESSLDVMTR